MSEPEPPEDRIAARHVADGERAEARRGDHPLVPEAPDAQHRAGRDLGEGRIDVEGQEALDALGLAQRDQEADPAAPVVAEEAEALDPELVEQREHVVGQALLLIAARRGVRPAEPAQVGADHAVALGQRADHVAPLVPVLRPAVEHHERLAFAGLGDVGPQAVGDDIAVLDAVNVGHPGQLERFGGRLGGHAGRDSR